MQNVYIVQTLIRLLRGIDGMLTPLIVKSVDAL